MLVYNLLVAFDNDKELQLLMCIKWFTKRDELTLKGSKLLPSVTYSVKNLRGNNNLFLFRGTGSPTSVEIFCFLAMYS